MNVTARWRSDNADQGRGAGARTERGVGRFFSIERVVTPGASAASYVPLVVAARGLSFVRLLVVARLLGAAGKAEFGLFQPAQELINWIVPLVLFGLADVAERYASRIEREGGGDGGGGRLRGWLWSQYKRLLGIGVVVGLVMGAMSPWIGAWAFHLGAEEKFRGVVLVVLCAVTIVVLALYQHLAAILRGIRAYGASAGMEVVSAGLFLIFSAVAAWRGER